MQFICVYILMSILVGSHANGDNICNLLSKPSFTIQAVTSTDSQLTLIVSDQAFSVPINCVKSNGRLLLQHNVKSLGKWNTLPWLHLFYQHHPTMSLIAANYFQKNKFATVLYKDRSTANNNSMQLCGFYDDNEKSNVNCLRYPRLFWGVVASIGEDRYLVIDDVYKWKGSQGPYVSIFVGTGKHFEPGKPITGATYEAAFYSDNVVFFKSYHLSHSGMQQKGQVVKYVPPMPTFGFRHANFVHLWLPDIRKVLLIKDPAQSMNRLEKDLNAQEVVSMEVVLFDHYFDCGSGNSSYEVSTKRISYKIVIWITIGVLLVIGSLLVILAGIVVKKRRQNKGNKSRRTSNSSKSKRHSKSHSKSNAETVRSTKSKSEHSGMSLGTIQRGHA